MSRGARGLALPEGIKAVILDMDGVVTDTASVHAAAWKRLFDQFLEEHARQTTEAFVPFDPDEDYRRYIDGRARYDGVRDFLSARGINLPEGDPSDSPDRATVCGLGNRKNSYFLDHVRQRGAAAYPSTIAFIERVSSAGLRTAIISASLNMAEVLEAAGVSDHFEVRVDGLVADELGLPGKPDPAVFLEAARRLGVEPSQAAVVEDAIAGVEAARRGGFGLVVGVDRAGHSDALRTAGADLVVSDLDELEVSEPWGSRG